MVNLLCCFTVCHAVAIGNVSLPWTKKGEVTQIKSRFRTSQHVYKRYRKIKRRKVSPVKEMRKFKKVQKIFFDKNPQTSISDNLLFSQQLVSQQLVSQQLVSQQLVSQQHLFVFGTIQPNGWNKPKICLLRDFGKLGKYYFEDLKTIFLRKKSIVSNFFKETDPRELE